MDKVQNQEKRLAKSAEEGKGEEAGGADLESLGRHLGGPGLSLARPTVPPGESELGRVTITPRLQART